MVKFEIQTTLPATPRTVYQSWLDSEQHSAMTGGAARCSDETGGSFTAWDGYIRGINLKLVPYSEIIQTWRTSEFSEEDGDSTIAISLEEHEEGCLLILLHTDIPEGQPDYEKGWFNHYFEPMKAYFG